MEPYVAPPRDAGGFGARAAAFAGVAGDAPRRGVGGGQSAKNVTRLVAGRRENVNGGV